MAPTKAYGFGRPLGRRRGVLKEKPSATSENSKSPAEGESRGAPGEGGSSGALEVCIRVARLLQVLIRARFEPILKCLGEFSGHSGFQMRLLATISSRRRPALLLQTKCACLLSAPCVVIVLSDFLSLCDRFLVSSWFCARSSLGSGFCLCFVAVSLVRGGRPAYFFVPGSWGHMHPRCPLPG